MLLAVALWSPAALNAAPIMNSESAFFMQLEQIRMSMKLDIQQADMGMEAAPDPAAAQALVIEKLKGSGVPPQYVQAAFARPEVKIYEEIAGFFDKPAESLPYEEYRKRLITEARIRKGVEFFRAHQALLHEITYAYNTDPLLLTSLVGVESNYGMERARYTVFNALYTVILRVPKRSKWAANELAEYLKYCYADKVDPQGINGSYAGAFGFGQFMPSSFNKYAVDYDRDGIRTHDTWPDVLASVSNYLIQHGYPPGSSDFSFGSPVWKAIYAYNHSDNYVHVLIDLREEIKKRL
jgi:membrane-bound lytic murein transglycosylase B